MVMALYLVHLVLATQVRALLHDMFPGLATLLHACSWWLDCIDSPCLDCIAIVICILDGLDRIAPFHDD